MSLETPYRLAILVMFAAAMSIAAYHRLQAAKSGERFDRREEGLALAVVLRLAGLGLWLSTVIYLLWPDAIRWSQLNLPDGLRWSGGLAGVCGIALLYWALINLGKNLTDTVATRQGATLITKGPYRWIRHPFYVAAGLLMLAAALLASNWLIGACGLLVITLLVLRTPKEEQKLIERFGDEYRQYMTKTGRFVPRIGS